MHEFDLGSGKFDLSDVPRISFRSLFFLKSSGTASQKYACPKNENEEEKFFIENHAGFYHGRAVQLYLEKLI